MAIKFIDCDGYTNFIAENDNGSVIGSIDIDKNGQAIFNELNICEIEQILDKMKELHGGDKV